MCTLILVWIVLPCTFLGQLATVNDPDGWSNVRDIPSGNGSIIDQVLVNQFFWYNGEEYMQGNKWVEVVLTPSMFYRAGDSPFGRTGYIHRSRIVPLHSLKEFNGGGFQFHYETEEYDPNKVRIDVKGQSFKSVSFSMASEDYVPLNQIKAVVAQAGDFRVDIPAELVDDLFNAWDEMEPQIFQNDKALIVSTTLGDGAEGYYVVWVFDQGMVKQRIVYSMYDPLELFDSEGYE